MNVWWGRRGVPNGMMHCRYFLDENGFSVLLSGWMPPFPPMAARKVCGPTVNRMCDGEQPVANTSFSRVVNDCFLYVFVCKSAWSFF